MILPILLFIVGFLISNLICIHNKKITCKKNDTKIPFWYLLSDIGLGILFASGYLIYGISYNYFIFIILATLLLSIFISDFQNMIILDSHLITSVILLLIVKICFQGLEITFKDILSGLVLFIIMYLIMLLGNLIFKKESLGGGDIKLSFIIGLALGFKLGLSSIILSAFLALPYALATLYMKDKSELPFGPFMASALIIVFIFSDKFLNLISYLLYWI